MAPIGWRFATISRCSGITNYLLDLVVKTLSCKLENIRLLTVHVIDEMLADASYSYRRFSWQLQQPKFTSEVMVLPWRCSELVLGAQWLPKIDAIIWNFSTLNWFFFSSREGAKCITLFWRFPNLPAATESFWPLCSSYWLFGSRL